MKIFATILFLWVLLKSFNLVSYVRSSKNRGKEIVGNLSISFPAIIAHRGLSAVAPESTAIAYIKARNAGADYLEADLRRTKDGKIVIFHDRNLKRLSNIEYIYPTRKNDDISSFTYKEIKRLDFGKWFNKAKIKYSAKEYEGLAIITLEELIEISQFGENNVGLVLETKDSENYPGIEEDIIRILYKKGCLRKRGNGEYRLEEKDAYKSIILFSFSMQSLKKFRRLAPDIPRLLLFKQNIISISSWKICLEKAKGLAHGIGVKGFISLPRYIKSANDNGLFFFVYTVNQRWQIKLLSYLQVDGYISNRADIARELLADKSKD